MTIHITPESEFSYVSFETNVPQKSYKDLIARVVATFGPKQFVMTFFTSLVCHDEPLFILIINKLLSNDVLKILFILVSHIFLIIMFSVKVRNFMK